MTIYLRIQPLGTGDLAACGPVISRHRSPEAAARADVREQRACVRANGPSTWVDRNVVAVDPGTYCARRELTDDEAEDYWRAHAAARGY